MALRGVLAVVLVALVGYALLEAVPLLSGPSLTIETPAPYVTGAEGFVTISGTAKYTETLSLNQGPLLIDEKDRFATTLLLPRGSAILTLTATDRFGRSVTERRTVFIP